MNMHRRIIAFPLLFLPLTVGIVSCRGQKNDRETPRSYNRKLRLAPPLTAFLHLEAGEQCALSWELQTCPASGYGPFVDSTWHAAYDMFRPQPLETRITREEVLEVLAEYFKESYTEGHDLKGFSGVELRTDRCEKRGILEIGFVGRVLLNAFNALEYGTAVRSDTLVSMATEIFDSYLHYGFTPGGLLREVVDLRRGTETEIYSIRRQSEGIRALLLYLDFEKKRGIPHPEWENRVKQLLGTLMKLEQPGHSYPRKFTVNPEITDFTGGSSPAFVPSLVMAYRYFSDSSYLDAAERVMSYMEDSIIGPSDYFSSTLDAFCEDKEASLYTATACYYMALVSEGEKKAHYTRLAKEASAFALSYFIMSGMFRLLPARCWATSG